MWTTNNKEEAIPRLNETIEEEEQRRFKKLPKFVQFQAIEYYSLVKKFHKGIKLTPEEKTEFRKLSKVIDEHNITSLSFEGDVI